MGKYKKLLSDTFAFTISSFASKILVFLLIPLYTSVLTTEEYGISDLINNLVNVIYPILTLSIAEATLRFAFEKHLNKSEVLSNSLLLTFISETALVLFTPFVKYMSMDMYRYWIWFLFIYFGFNVQLTLSQYVKGIGKTKLFAVAGVMHTIIVVALNIIGLVVLKWGLNGYLLSMAAGYYGTIVFMIVKGHLLKDIIHFRINNDLLKKMVLYSAPTIPTYIAWWVSMSADKYIIIAKLGMAASGVYAVSYKIPSVLNMVTTIFTSAWTLSAIENVNEADNAKYHTKIYNYFNGMSVIVCSLLIIGAQITGRILYAKEFYRAWECVPMLLIAYLFSGLSGFLASAYRATKKTNVLFISTCVGALLNIILNFWFVEYFGIIGAAYTTMFSFFVVWLVRLFIMQKNILKLRLNIIRDSAVYLMLIAQALIMQSQIRFSYVYVCIIFGLILVCEFGILKELIGNALVLIKNVTKRKKQPEVI